MSWHLDNSKQFNMSVTLRVSFEDILTMISWLIDMTVIMQTIQNLIILERGYSSSSQKVRNHCMNYRKFTKLLCMSEVWKESRVA